MPRFRVRGGRPTLDPLLGAFPRLREESDEMCLNCGCMRAHDDMGKPEINITYEDVKRAADGNGMTVDATLAMIARTSDKDRGDHPVEYAAQAARDLGRLDDDGGPSVPS